LNLKTKLFLRISLSINLFLLVLYFPWFHVMLRVWVSSTFLLYFYMYFFYILVIK
jgi:hypothetical protein